MQPRACRRATGHRATFVAAVALAACAPALAQEPIDAAEIDAAYAQLAERLDPGDTVFVTRASGDVVHGRLRSASPLTLEEPRLLGRNGQASRLGVAALELAESDVKRLEVVRGDPVWNGGLIGLAVGAAVVFAADCNSPECDDIQPVAIPLTLALGASVGALVDALRKEREVVYQSPVAEGPAVSLVPILDRYRRGVAVTLRF